MFGRLRQKLFPQAGVEKQLLLYGLQRSGTNFLKSLIHLNYPDCRFGNGAVRNAVDHKHFRLYDNKEIIPEPQFENQMYFPSFPDFENALQLQPDIYLVISKDPYSWFVSYTKWSQKNNWPPHAYHYIEEYNLFYGKWMEFSKQTNKILFIRYVDLLQEPLRELHKIANTLQIAPVDQMKTAKKVYASRKFTGAKKEEFLKNEHLAKISAEDLQMINIKLNTNLMAFLGYDFVK